MILLCRSGLVALNGRVGLLLKAFGSLYHGDFVPLLPGRLIVGDGDEGHVARHPEHGDRQDHLGVVLLIEAIDMDVVVSPNSE